MLFFFISPIGTLGGKTPPKPEVTKMSLICKLIFHNVLSKIQYISLGLPEPIPSQKKFSFFKGILCFVSLNKITSKKLFVIAMV